jgi:hypothetical protein
MLIQL